MPKKRTKNMNKYKQKKLLKVRLVKISMVIEDYLYKFKPVSTSEARAYVEEVSNYKQQCVGDARSLQVIEKITRCMNSIIAEQQEDRADCINFQHVSENYCPSPVYSLAEEDGILDQTTILNTNVEVARKENNDFETIDLCDDEDDDANRNISVEVEIHRAMSNLSIRVDNHINDVNVNTIDCSQSILKDFNDNRAQEIKKTIAAKTFQAGPECSSSINGNEQFDTQSVLADFNQTNTQLIKNSSNSKRRLLSEENNQVKTLKIPNNEKPLRNIKKEIIKQTGNKVKFDDAIETIDSPENIIDKHHQKRNTKQLKNKTSAKKVRVVKRKTINSSIKVSEGPVDTFSKVTDKFTSNVYTIPIMNETVQQKTQSTGVCGLNKVKNSALNKSMTKIYNNNVENDLSWVENIRYVREISTEEFDPKYRSLADSFWENYALPNDWNEKYFD